MQFGLNKMDAVYLAAIVLLSYLLLVLMPETPLESYAKLAAMRENGIMPPLGIALLPVFIGTVIAAAMFLASRVWFKQTQFAAFFVVLLFISSKAFVGNFMANSTSELTLAILGMPSIPSFSLQKIFQNAALLPFALFSMYFLFRKKKMKELVTGIAAVAVSVFSPLIGAPILMILASDGIQRIQEKGKENMLLGGLIAFAATTILLPISMQTIALAALVGIVAAIVMFAFESKHKIAYSLCIVLLFLSLQAGTIQVLTAQRMDAETVSALDQLNSVSGKIAIASTYGDNASAAAYARSGKTVTTSGAFRFLFTSDKPSFDYLLLDTFVLDEPQRFAAMGNATAKFETFMYVQRYEQNGSYTAVFASVPGVYLLMNVDSRGSILGDKVAIGNSEESFYRLVQLNTTDSRLSRFIHPRTDSDKNVFKLIFPEKFGSLEGVTMTQVWQSNSSRMRLYKFG